MPNETLTLCRHYNLLSNCPKCSPPPPDTIVETLTAAGDDRQAWQMRETLKARHASSIQMLPCSLCGKSAGISHNGEAHDFTIGLFPHDSKARKAIPIVTGWLNYFPAATAEGAKVSKAGNDKHNPGQPLHHARGKSMDHADSACRHIMEFEANHDAVDPDSGLSVLAHALWRVAALLQEHLESKGAPLAPGAKLP